MATKRTVVSRSAGTPHGPITRLIDPKSNGDQLKPFIFLDFFSADVKPGFGFPIHPHSGIATLTWQPGTDVKYIDTMGHTGILKAGGLEWMNAGGGAWHQGALLGHGDVFGFQLWVPMPPGIEDGPPGSQYVAPEDVPSWEGDGVTLQVFLGRLGVGPVPLESVIDDHQDMNYFVVSLQSDAEWAYTPPASHDVAWAFAFHGSPTINGDRVLRELVQFSPGAGSIVFAAGKQGARLLVGSARSHPYQLVLGSSSVHTNAESLSKGLKKIDSIGEMIRASDLTLDL